MGKEDFLIVVIVPICADLVMGWDEVEKMVDDNIPYLKPLSMGDRCIR